MNKITVFFDHKMNVTIPLPSPSPRKPAELIKQWQDIYPIQLSSFLPIKVEDIYLAHEKDHVDQIISLEKENGMDTKDKELIDSLYWTIGSLYASAKYAIHHEVAVSPTSGFHHAGYNYAWGFCTFNGLLITALKLLNDDKINKIGILDFDQHQGDGSEDIIYHLKCDEKIIHITGKTHYSRERNAFFNELENGLLNIFKGCDVVLYQAGADQYINDPLGGFLDLEYLRKRDRFVFNFMKSNHIPITWNLAGGYQEDKETGSIQKVLDIHHATMEECIKVYFKT